jgi:hypothetical protein
MSTTTSSVLKKHFNKQKHTQSHLEYLDKILWDINPTYREKFLEIRKSIELTLLDNPESENKVVSYLSGVSEKLNLINRKKWNFIREEVNATFA